MTVRGFDVNDGECICFPFMWLFELCLLVRVWGVWIHGEVRVVGCGEGRVGGNRRLTCWRASLISFGVDLN